MIDVAEQPLVCNTTFEQIRAQGYRVCRDCQTPAYLHYSTADVGVCGQCGGVGVITSIIRAVGVTACRACNGSGARP